MPDSTKKTDEGLQALICKCGASLDRGKINMCLKSFGYAACCRCGAEFRLHNA